MVDLSFYENKGPYTLGEISQHIGCKFHGDKNKLIEDISTIEDAKPSEICFFVQKYKKYFSNSKAGAFIVNKIEKSNNDRNFILSVNPHLDMAKVASLFYPNAEYPSFFYKSENKHSSLSKTIKVSDSAFIHKTAKIGLNSEIGCNSVIGPGVVLGNDSIVGDNVSIYFSLIGKNARIYQGVKLGSEGFGFIMGKKIFKKIPQLGRVIIGDNVEVGANSTIDRGSIGDTVIGNSCMIDNIVHLGHNVRLGENCIIAAMTGISGSTTIGNNVIIGGQVGISGHINIGNNVTIAAKTGVMKDIKDNSTIAGYPSVKITDWHRNTILLKRLREHGKKS